MDKQKPKKNTKTKKCQPAAGDMPDLIQTEHVPNSWLARPPKKNIKNKKQIKIMSKPAKNGPMTNQVNQNLPENWACKTKNKKVSACCWGHARSNSNWACPQQLAGTPPQKNIKKKNTKDNQNLPEKWYNDNKSTKICQKTGRAKPKTKKCQPAAGDMPDLIQTEHVPNSWLARPPKKNIKNKKQKTCQNLPKKWTNDVQPVNHKLPENWTCKT